MNSWRGSLRLAGQAFGTPPSRIAAKCRLVLHCDRLHAFTGTTEPEGSPFRLPRDCQVSSGPLVSRLEGDARPVLGDEDLSFFNGLGRRADAGRARVNMAVAMRVGGGASRSDRGGDDVGACTWVRRRYRAGLCYPWPSRLCRTLGLHCDRDTYVISLQPPTRPSFLDTARPRRASRPRFNCGHSSVHPGNSPSRRAFSMAITAWAANSAAGRSAYR